MSQNNVNTHMDEFKAVHVNSAVVSPAQVKVLRNVAALPLIENGPCKEDGNQERKKHLVCFSYFYCT